MSSRDLILSRVREATRTAVDPTIPRDYLRSLEGEDIVGLFAERVDDYRAEVHRIPADRLALTVGEVLGRHGVGSVVVPADLDKRWLDTTSCAVVRDAPEVTAVELDQVDAVVTGCAAGIALTGTIVLDGGPAQGRRLITLVPDLHVCVVRTDRIVGTVPEVFDRIERTKPLTWISGPSATSDIELNRVEGVHGPRTLIVLIVED